MYISRKGVERYNLNDCIYTEYLVDEHDPENYIAVIAT
jgi:hypothetical protein